MTLTRKKVYAKGLVDRESIKAAMGAPNAGAFAELTKESAGSVVESFDRNMERILFGNGDGSLGTVDASIAVTGSNPFVVTLATESNLANFEESDFVNFGSGTSQFEITLVTENTNDTASPATITVQRLSGSDVPALSDTIFMQGSKDNDPHGLDEVLDLTSGTHDGIAIGRRWQAAKTDLSGSTIGYDPLIDMALDIRRRSGKSPDLLVCSYTQLGKLLKGLEDTKAVFIEPVSKDVQGKLGSTNIRLVIPGGSLEIMPARFCPEDRTYMLNSDPKYLSLHIAPDSLGFVDDINNNNSIFYYEGPQGNDQYSMFYTAYGQWKIVPTAHGVFTNGST